MQWMLEGKPLTDRWLDRTQECASRLRGGMEDLLYALEIGYSLGA
jgi:hypothetical protein